MNEKAFIGEKKLCNVAVSPVFGVLEYFYIIPG